jgi:hypothetical protein
MFRETHIHTYRNTRPYAVYLSFLAARTSVGSSTHCCGVASRRWTPLQEGELVVGKRVLRRGKKDGPLKDEDDDEEEESEVETFAAVVDVFVFSIFSRWFNMV